MKKQILVLCLLSIKAFGISDSLERNKLIWHLPVSGGISLGGNNLTYKNGGLIAVNTGVFVEKKSFLFGIDYFYTEFYDGINFDKKIGSLLGKAYTPTHTVKVVSLNFGKHIGDYRKKSLNVNLIGGIGILKYEYPIIIKNDIAFSFFPNQEYKVDKYYSQNVISLNGKVKSYFNSKGLLRGFAVISGFINSQISFYSLGLGIELNTSK